jgi:uncharacterized protein YbjT (DUF2867 family)
MPHHWLKMKVEGRLIESGLPYTILQPTAYMQNITNSLADILQKSTYQVPYPVNTRICLVDLEDVAQVAAHIMNEPGFLGGTYELVGTDPITQREVAQSLGTLTGKNIQAQQIPIAYWETRSKQAGLGPTQINALVKMFRHYQLFGLIGSSQVLGWLLGRQPTSLEECLKRELAALDSGTSAGDGPTDQIGEQ